MQILVLGMHRAGTSAITRLINMMGADMGPAHLIGEPAEDNEKGFWERTDVSRLNDRLLAGLDCTWDEIAGFAPDRLAAGLTDELREQVQRIIFQMDTHRPWVLKDPRLCLTLPVWRPLMEVPVCVLPHRSPLEIARSLQARNGLSLTHGIALWERYSLGALAASAGLPRFVVSYARLIEDPEAVVGELYQSLCAAEVGGLRLPSQREILAFVEGRLRHQRVTAGAEDGLLNLAQRRLAAGLEDGAALAWAEIPALSLGAAEALVAERARRVDAREAEVALNQARNESSAAQATVEGMAVEVAYLREEITQGHARVENLDRALTAERVEVTSMMARIEALSAELALAQTRAAGQDRALMAAREEATVLKNRMEAVTAELALAQAGAAEQERLLAAALAEAAGQETRLADLAGQVAMLSRWLNEIDGLMGATRESWRWRVGNRLVRAVEWLLLRAKPRLAIDQVSALLRQFTAWRSSQASLLSETTLVSLPPVGRDESSRWPALPFGPRPEGGSAPAPHLTGYELLCLPIIDWDFRFQRPQQLARRFVGAGHRVYYVGLSFGTELARCDLETGVVGVTLPGRATTNVYRDLPTAAETERLVEALLTLTAAADHTPWVCLVQLPYWGPVAEGLRERLGCLVVYDCMDDHAGFSTNAPAMLAAETRLLEKADLVVASSRLLLDKVAPLARRTRLIRNAVDYPHFAVVAPSQHRTPERLIVGYYGAIADWFDSDLVGALAGLRPHWRFVLIGDTFSADLASLEGRANISLPGEQPYALLPGLIADWDCCIIPFKRLPLTEATNPVKVYEMLAAGKPVVAVPLPELLPIAELDHIALAETAEAFALAIEREVGHDSAARQVNRRDYARANTWELRQRDLEAAIAECVPLVSIVIVTFNNQDLNRQCLESLLGDTDYPNFEVIVVDNGSHEGTPELLRRVAAADPRVRIILNPDNKGFAAANNQALAIARGDFLCLLNNDTVVAGAWLSTLVRYLQRDPRLGLIGPVTNAIGNEAQIPVDYEQIGDMPGWAAAHCRRHRGQLVDIGMLAFFCVVMPRAVYRTVGPLDEAFGIGMFEDDDYNDRVRAAGFAVKLARDSFIHHWQRASFKLLGEEEYLRVYYENKDRYREKSALTVPRRRALEALRQRCEGVGSVVLFPPSIGWNIPLFQRPHHLARALAERGEVAIFDCTGSSVDEVDLLREIEPGVFLFQGSPTLLRDLPRLTLWTFTYNYGYRDYFGPGVCVLYDWIDDLSVFPYDQGWLMALHERAVRESEVVAAVARTLHADLLATRPDALYLPNAVDAVHFRQAPEPNPASRDKDFARILASGKPIAGYYGALAHWFDYELLGRVARLREDWSFVLIGPDLDGSLRPSGITELANVQWLGPRDYSQLAGYLHLFDVAMIPFKINEITIATSPLKLFEYFAGGRGVITTPMPECVAFADVLIAPNAAAFAEHLDRARGLTGDPGYIDRLAPVVAGNTWAQRVQQVLDALN